MAASIALPQSLTLANASAALAEFAPRVREALQAPAPATPAAAGAPAIEFDASALDDFDSGALAVLLECRRIAAEGPRPFSVHGVALPLIDLAELYGVDEVLQLQPRAPDAAR